MAKWVGNDPNKISYGYNVGYVDRYWPPNEMVVELQGSFAQDPITSVATAYCNDVSAFQAWGFGGNLDGGDCASFVTANTSGTATKQSPAMVFSNWDALKGEYNRAAIISTEYSITFMSPQEVPQGFSFMSWTSDHDYTGPGAYPGETYGITTTGQLQNSGDTATVGMPADPVRTLAYARDGVRHMRPIVRTSITGDNTQNRATLHWKPDYRMQRDVRIKGPPIKTASITGHPSGQPAVTSAAVASFLTTDYGMYPRLNVLGYRTSMGGDTTPDRSLYIDQCIVRVKHKILLYNRVRG